MKDQQDTSSFQSELGQIQHSLDQQSTDIHMLKKLVQASSQKIGSLKNMLTHNSRPTGPALQEDISKARANLASDGAYSDTSDTRLAAIVSERDNTLEKGTRMEALLTERMADIALLGEEIGRLQKANAALSKDRLSEVSELGLLLEQKEQTIATLESQLAQTQARIAALMAFDGPQKRLHAALHNVSRFRRSGRRARAQVAADIVLVTESDLFDPEWYRTTYPDIGSQDPVQHFVEHGAYELRNPSPAFDSLKYHMANPDVTQKAFPGLLHYLRHGKADGRAIYPVG